VQNKTVSNIGQPLFWVSFGHPPNVWAVIRKKLEGTMTTESRVDRRQLRRRADRFAQHVTEEIASLRAALDIQFMRIAQIQAELDLSRAAINGRPVALLPKSSAGISS